MDGGLAFANAMASSPAAPAAAVAPSGGAVAEPGQDGSFLDALARNLAVAAAPIPSVEPAGLGVAPPHPAVTPDFPVPIAAMPAAQPVMILPPASDEPVMPQPPAAVTDAAPAATPKAPLPGQGPPAIASDRAVPEAVEEAPEVAPDAVAPDPLAGPEAPPSPAPELHAAKDDAAPAPEEVTSTAVETPVPVIPAAPMPMPLAAFPAVAPNLGTGIPVRSGRVAGPEAAGETAGTAPPAAPPGPAMPLASPAPGAPAGSPVHTERGGEVAPRSEIQSEALAADPSEPEMSGDPPVALSLPDHAARADPAVAAQPAPVHRNPINPNQDSPSLVNLPPALMGQGIESIRVPRPDGSEAATPPASPTRQIAPIAIALAFTPGVAGGFNLTLDPVELGRVEIRVQREGESHSVQVVAERPETLALLQRDRLELDRSLADAGLRVDSQGIDFSLASSGGQPGQGDAQHRPALRRDAGAVPLPMTAEREPLPPRVTRGLLDLNI